MYRNGTVLYSEWNVNGNLYSCGVVRGNLYIGNYFARTKIFWHAPQQALGTRLYSKRILMACSLRRVVLSRGFRLREEGPLSKTLPFYSAFGAALISSLYSRGPNRIRLACDLLFLILSLSNIIYKPRAFS